MMMFDNDINDDDVFDNDSNKHDGYDDESCRKLILMTGLLVSCGMVILGGKILCPL